MNCIPPSGCRCCECRGIHCFVGHPGHSHRTRLAELLGYSIDLHKLAQDERRANNMREMCDA